VAVGETVVGGPFTGAWQPGCPQGSQPANSSGGGDNDDNTDSGGSGGGSNPPPPPNETEEA
jgi:hypothetical protein